MREHTTFLTRAVIVCNPLSSPNEDMFERPDFEETNTLFRSAIRDKEPLTAAPAGFPEMKIRT